MLKRKHEETDANGLLVMGNKGKVNHNEDLCKILEEMGRIEKNKGLIHKWKAYRVATDSLKGLDHRIASGAEATKLAGVGARIAARIDEILQTGQLNQLNDYNEDPIVKATNLFTAITGVGPKGAHVFVEKGYRTLEDIVNSNEPLTGHQKIGLKHYDDFLKKIPYSEVKRLMTEAENGCKQIDSKLILTACGSHRRGKKMSGDIDCLMTHPLTGLDSGETYTYLRKVSKKLREVGFIIDTISEGSTKVMAVCQLPSLPARRIDIRWVPYDSYPTALLYFTGSNVFNTTMRATALKKGYTLNEYGLYKCVARTNLKEERVHTETEKDVFAALGIKYCPPEERDV